jgi:hypothetical protein
MVMTVEQSVESVIGRENRSTRSKPTAVPLCPPQIPHDLISVQTLVTVMGAGD